MNGRWWWGAALCAALCAAGCDDGGGDDAPADGGGGTADGGGGSADMGGPGDDGGPPADMGPLPDMGPPPPSCFADGAELIETRVTEPWAGAQDLRADLDTDADGAPDVMVQLVEAAGVTVVELNAADLSETGRWTVPGAASATLMPNVWPPRRAQGPVEGVWVVLARNADDATRLVLVDAESGAVRREHALAAGVDRITTMNTTGAGWRVLVDLADGGCAAYDLSAADPIYADTACRLRPAWDVDEDGTIDVARDGTVGPTVGALLQGGDLSPIAEAERPLFVGFNPINDAPDALPPGPQQLRSEMVEPDEENPMPEPRGPELMGPYVDDRLNVGFLDPDTLAQLGMVTPQFGAWQRVEVHGSRVGMRLWVQYQSNDLQFVAVYQVGDFIRQLMNFGPYEFVQWGLGPDVNQDGFPDIRITGGSRDDLRAAPILHVDAADGAQHFMVEADSSGLYDLVLLSSDQGAVPPDLDGCPGQEFILLRAGIPARSGQTGTRLQVNDIEGERLFRGPPVDGFVHQVRVTDLGGDGTLDVLELKSTDEDNAALSILNVAAPQ